MNVNNFISNVIGKCGYNTYLAIKMIEEMQFTSQEDKDLATKLYMEHKNSELVQYFLVNTDLNMSAGKVGAQVAHAATWIASNMTGDSFNLSCYSQSVEDWTNWDNGAVVVLGATDKQMRDFRIHHGHMTYEIIDQGRTEGTVDAMTVIGLEPMPRGYAQEIIGEFPVLADNSKKYREALTNILTYQVGDEDVTKSELEDFIRKLKEMAAIALIQ